ncbi:hypothetical protein [Stackebrandtia soli]|uniref:hypothetical protein n=1 Tax=Stackebrandtia soli TaxID=1892856 RepID=UPI0039EB293C
MLDYDTRPAILAEDAEALITQLADALTGWDYSSSDSVRMWTLVDPAEDWTIAAKVDRPEVIVRHDELGRDRATTRLLGVSPAVIVSVLIALGAPEVE